MSPAIRMCRAICQAGIGLAMVSAVAGCSDEPASEKSAVMERAGSDARPDPESAADSGKPASGATADAGQSASAGMRTDAGGAGGDAGAGTAAPDGADGMAGPAVSSGRYTISQCPNAAPPTEGRRNDFPACDGKIQCGGPSQCIPIDRLKTQLSDNVIARTPDCSAGKCLPDEFVSAGKFSFKACSNDLGEGRCIPQCFAVWVMPLSAIFERGASGCGSEEVCAPCRNPLTQEPTGACESDMCQPEPEM